MRIWGTCAIQSKVYLHGGLSDNHWRLVGHREQNFPAPIPTIAQVWVTCCQYFEKWRAKLSQGKDNLHPLFSCQQPLTPGKGRLPHHKQAISLFSLPSSSLLDIKEAALTELIWFLKPAISWHSYLYSSKVIYCVDVVYVLILYFPFH